VKDDLWIQRNLVFAGDTRADQEHKAVAHLTQALTTVDERELITSVWFIRKEGAWRVRYRLAEPTTNAQDDPVHRIVTRGLEWTPDVYEPEIHPFGGPESMRIAHELFHRDSRHLLPYLLNDPGDRREHSLVLCTALMRAAGLDFNEQGDVWGQVLTDYRAAVKTESVSPETWAAFTRQAAHLLRGNARPELIDSGWIAAFTDAGSALKVLRARGILTRGLRAVIALHIIFHWNRLGLDAPAQAHLARAAKEAILGGAEDGAIVPA
jgi:thiopeptide-type bacteriocin biosynthesis protein